MKTNNLQIPTLIILLAILFAALVLLPKGVMMGEPTITPLEAFLAADNGCDREYDIGSYHCVHFSCALIDNLTAAGFNAQPVLLATYRSGRWSHMVVAVEMDNETVFIEPITNEMFPISGWDEDIALGDEIIYQTISEALPQAIPHTDDELVEPTNVSATPVSAPVPYDDLWYNETNLSTVSDFIQRMPVYPGKGQCVAHSRYMAFEAKEHNLTISTCIVGGSGSASKTEKHQVATFKDDGVRYYTANTYPGDQRILTAGALVAYLDSKYPGGMTHLSARDYWTP